MHFDESDGDYEKRYYRRYTEQIRKQKLFRDGGFCWNRQVSRYEEGLPFTRESKRRYVVGSAAKYDRIEENHTDRRDFTRKEFARRIFHEHEHNASQYWRKNYVYAGRNRKRRKTYQIAEVVEHKRGQKFFLRLHFLFCVRSGSPRFKSRANGSFVEERRQRDYEGGYAHPYCCENREVYARVYTHAELDEHFVGIHNRTKSTEKADYAVTQVFHV